MGYCKKKDKNRELLIEIIFFINLFLIVFILMFQTFVSALPDGPTDVDIDSNETKATVGAYISNISGGYISQMNLTAVSQNVRWKAFVGQVFGRFTLDDANGSTIYDWSIATIAGEVFATRKTTSVTWTNLSCASKAKLETENINMSHTSAEDNISRTFNNSGIHNEFFIAGVNISAGSCFSLNTFINDSSQSTYFDEVALYEGLSDYLVFTTIIENNKNAYDNDGAANNKTNDFQMIVPEVGSGGFNGATPYYLYVELG